MSRRLGSAALVVGALGVCAAAAPAAVPTPGPPQTRAIAIVGGLVHPVVGPDIANGVVVFEHGRITALGPAATTAIPAGAERIEAAGKHVYPGLIDPWTTMGLTEIDAVRSTRDFAETAPLAPNVRADVAFQPESELIPVARSNGVLLAHATPRGGVIAGRSALMELDGWTPVEMTVKAPLGLVVNWPPMVLVPSDPGGPPEDRQKENRDRALRQIAQAFDDAQSYRAARTAQSPRDLRWEAMQPVLEGTAPLFVVAEEVHQIEAAVAFAAQRHMKLVLYGGYDAPQVAALLKEHDVAVIVPSTQRLPRRRSDPYDAAFTLPAALSRAGIRFCIGATGRSWESRNLPYQAATAQAFGLSAAEALRAITLSTAQILGTADRVGALAPGRDATLFVSDGDILDEPTHVEQAFVEGRRVDLTDKQKVLNDKYREKYRRLGIATKP